MKNKAIILAAGQGKRMKSDIPKVLHKVAGKEMLHHIIENTKKAGIEDIIVVIGVKSDLVKESLKKYKNVKTVYQKEQLGTGHAVMMADEYLVNKGTTIVLCGDAPLITPKTIKDLVDSHLNSKQSSTVLTAYLQNPKGYGRIIKEGNLLKAIVEDKDASESEYQIKEVNSGAFAFDTELLKKYLKRLDNNNSQNEYYLTDILELLRLDGYKIGSFQMEDEREIKAVNSRVQLSEVEDILRDRIIKSHMDNGVTFINKLTNQIGSDVKIGKDTIIESGAVLMGCTEIGENVLIGQNSRIEDSKIDSNISILNSVIKDSKVGEGSTIGPFAYLRPNSIIGKNVKIGDFVEVKNSVIGDNSKASHHAYIGDGVVGKNVNIGCGVIFVNYDGKEKSKTIIENNAFIGSNTNLVAPLRIEENAFIAAGSTITKEVEKNALAVARAKQRNIKDWANKR